MLKRFFWGQCGIGAALLGALLAGCLNLPDEGKQPILNPEQKQFLALDRKTRVARFADEQERIELQKAGWIPQAMPCRVQSDGKVTVTLREKWAENTWNTKTFDNDRITVIAPSYVRTAWAEGELYFCNFKLATAYTLTECTADESKRELSRREFTTEDIAPRLLAIDGVPNVRDLGGRIGQDGRRVKQGMIYRSAGLNDNAKPEYVPLNDSMVEEMAWRTPAKEQVRAGLKALSQVILREVDDYEENDKWVVYAPGRGLKETDCLELAALTGVPEKLLDMNARPIELDAAKRFAFPVPTLYSPSVFVKKIHSDKERTVRAGCGADWFFRVYLNGKVLYDALTVGNISTEIVPADNPLLLPLAQGDNYLVIPVLSGDAGWAFSFGAVSSDPKAIRDRQIASLEKHLKELDIVRTGKLIPGKNRLSPEMQNYLVKDLGIKTDLDLRNDEECFGMKGSPAGDAVKWVHISSSSYQWMQTEEGRKAFAKDFRLFLDEKNYPIVFHCIAGQDRTGSLAFILNALLGVEEEELYRDWEATGFWNSDTGFSHRTRFDRLVEEMGRGKGETIQTKVEDYVKGCGFSTKEIEKFRTIMLERK